MDSFIRWIGGKKLLRNEIINRFPKDGVQKYIEVFGGAAWVLFHKDKHAPVEVYNDINSELVNLFRCMKYHPEAVQKELDFYLSSREMFYIQLKSSIEYMTDIQRAARYYFLIKLSFGANTTSFSCKASPTFGMIKTEELKKRLSRVVIENKSFDQIIKVQDSEGSLFYCDPPYHSTEKYYDTGEFVFNNEEHIKLRDMLSAIKGKFILSYNDDEFIRDLYSEFKIEEVERNHNLANAHGVSKRYKELIITNY